MHPCSGMGSRSIDLGTLCLFALRCVSHAEEAVNTYEDAAEHDDHGVRWPACAIWFPCKRFDSSAASSRNAH